MCLWLSPTYPLTLIFKPELAEVREEFFSHPFTQYMVQRVVNTFDIAHCTDHPLGFSVAMDSYPDRVVVVFFFFGFRCCSLVCFVSFLFLFFSLHLSRAIPWVLEVFLSPVAASLVRVLVSATGPGREGYGITGPCLGVCHRPGEGGVLPIMAYTERLRPKGIPFIR